MTASFRATFEKLYEKRLKDGDIQESEPGLTLTSKPKSKSTKKGMLLSHEVGELIIFGCVSSPIL